MSVVKFPVVFLGPSACPSSGTSSKPSAPLPAKYLIENFFSKNSFYLKGSNYSL